MTKMRPWFTVGVWIKVCREIDGLFDVVFVFDEDPSDVVDVDDIEAPSDVVDVFEPPFEVELLKVSPEMEIVSEPSRADETLIVVLMINLKLFALDRNNDEDDDKVGLEDDGDVNLDDFALEVVSCVGL